MKDEQKLLYKQWNYMSTSLRDDGTYLVRCRNIDEETEYELVVKDLWGPNEEVVSKSENNISAARFIKSRMVEVFGSPPGPSKGKSGNKRTRQLKEKKNE